MQKLAQISMVSVAGQTEINKMVNKLAPYVGSDAKAQKVIENVINLLSGTYEDDMVIQALRDQVDALIQNIVETQKLSKLEVEYSKRLGSLAAAQAAIEKVKQELGPEATNGALI